jgi:hypothetical protein
MIRSPLINPYTYYYRIILKNLNPSNLNIITPPTNKNSAFLVQKRPNSYLITLCEKHIYIYRQWLRESKWMNALHYSMWVTNPRNTFFPICYGTGKGFNPWHKSTLYNRLYDSITGEELIYKRHYYGKR